MTYIKIIDILSLKFKRIDILYKIIKLAQYLLFFNYI